MSLHCLQCMRLFPQHKRGSVVGAACHPYRPRKGAAGVEVQLSQSCCRRAAPGHQSVRLQCGRQLHQGRPSETPMRAKHPQVPAHLPRREQEREHQQRGYVVRCSAKLSASKKPPGVLKCDHALGAPIHRLPLLPHAERWSLRRRPPLCRTKPGCHRPLAGDSTANQLGSVIPDLCVCGSGEPCPGKQVQLPSLMLPAAGNQASCQTQGSGASPGQERMRLPHAAQLLAPEAPACSPQAAEHQMLTLSAS
mmetsp:Transcript_59420/g.117760  ORF Transcript_59420/g.117760 Transcript_59420/m.117760 type:complete len:250 (+) Transcript_59420:1471-2220(+)